MPVIPALWRRGRRRSYLKPAPAKQENKKEKNIFTGKLKRIYSLVN
jgi:hypothetical protein